MQNTNVGMAQRRDGARLALEALAPARVGRDVAGQNFDGYRAVKARIPRTINFAHAAGAEAAEDLIRTQFCAACNQETSDLWSDKTKIYFFSSASQFTTRVSGTEVAACCCALMTKCLPSRLTS